MSSLWLNVLLIFIFLVLGSVFSGTELALVSLRGSQLDQMEQEHVQRAVEQCRGNMSKAAEMLVITRHTLYKKLKK